MLNINAFSGFTDKAPLSPAYFNSKMSEVFSAITGLNNNLPVTISGATITTDTGYSFVAPSLDSGGFGYNLKAFAPSTGTDWTTALRSVLSVSNGGCLLVPPGTYYLGSTVTLSKQIKIFGAGGQGTTTFMKTHGDNMFDIISSNVEMHNINLEADTTTASAATSGWALFVTAGSGNFKFLGGAMNSMNSNLRFDDDAGSGSFVDNVRIGAFNNGSVASALAISIGSDTAARQRYFTNVNMPGGSVSIGSAQDTFLTGCQFDHLMTVEGAFGIHLADCRYGAGSTSTFHGDTCYVIGNSSSGTQDIASGFDGVFALNCRTQGGLVDSTASSGVVIIDHSLWKMPSTATLSLYGRLKSFRTLAASAVTVSAANTNLQPDEIVFTIGGASGASLCIHSGGTVYIFSSALSAKAT